MTRAVEGAAATAMEGAAAATAIAVISWNLAALVMVRHHLGVRPAVGGLF